MTPKGVLEQRMTAVGDAMVVDLDGGYYWNFIITPTLAGATNVTLSFDVSTDGGDTWTAVTEYIDPGSSRFNDRAVADDFPMASDSADSFSWIRAGSIFGKIVDADANVDIYAGGYGLAQVMECLAATHFRCVLDEITAGAASTSVKVQAVVFDGNWNYK